MPRRDKLDTIRVIKQLYEVQDRRCAVCDNEIPHKDENGHTVRKYEDRSGLVICSKCNLIVNYLRKNGSGPTLDRAIRLVKTGKI